MKPFYHLTSQIWIERATYFNAFLYDRWVRRKAAANPPGKFGIIQSIMGFATEPFDYADRTGALKIIDCPNSHPTTYYGYWQRECDVWCPGEKVPIPRWVFGRMNRELRRADLVIVQSAFCKESMVANGIREDRVMINPMGVDTSVFPKRCEVPLKPRFICVGTICLRKGHQYLFRAFEIVKRQLPEAELVCIGDYKRDFRLERPKWEGTFTHFPRLSHSEISRELRASTAFVFPSQEEGIARAQIEALATGLPVIGTHSAGTTTLVNDGIEGFIVRGQDPQHIADAMLRLGRDRELSARMGEAAYKKGASRNTWQDYGDRLIQEYTNRLAVRQKQGA